MLNWLSNLGKKPDHPMYNVAEAQKLLADSSADHGKALEEIGSWLHGVTATEGFPPADRIGVVKLLDETGQERGRHALSEFLRSTTLKDYERFRLWQVLVEFWEHAATAYRLCLEEFVKSAKPGAAADAERALLTARALRVLANEAKVLCLRYLPVKARIWHQLRDLYAPVENEKIATELIRAYPTDPVSTSVRQEFLRALMLEASVPESQQQQDMELSARIIARLASGFVVHAQPEAGCHFCFDLAQPSPPVRHSPDTPAAPTLRYFGAGRADAAIREIIDRHTANPQEPEKRFGDDFSIQEKLVVMKRLLLFWGDAPPKRRGPRVKIDAAIKLARGFEAASELVTRVEFSGMAEMTEDMRMKVKKKQQDGITLEAQQSTAVIHEWVERDASAWGIGVDVPRKDESWARIGALCTFQAAGVKSWWVGVIRRLERDSEDHEHAGIEVLAKKPLSVYLRGIGEGAQRADAWASSSGSYEYTYVNALILGEASASASRQEMLVPRDTFSPGLLFEAMVGEQTPHVRLEELLDRGEDYDHVRVTWVKRAG